MKTIKINGKEFTLPEGIELTDNEQALLDALLTYMDEEFQKLTPEGEGAEEQMSMEEVEKAITGKLTEFKYKLEDDDKFKEIQKALKDIGIKTKALEEKAVTVAGRKTVGQAFKEYYLNNKKDFEDLLSGRVKEMRIEVKTAGTILDSTNVTGTIPQAERLPGLVA